MVYRHVSSMAYAGRHTGMAWLHVLHTVYTYIVRIGLA